MTRWIRSRVPWQPKCYHFFLLPLVFLETIANFQFFLPKEHFQKAIHRFSKFEPPRIAAIQFQIARIDNSCTFQTSSRGLVMASWVQLKKATPETILILLLQTTITPFSWTKQCRCTGSYQSENTERLWCNKNNKCPCKVDAQGKIGYIHNMNRSWNFARVAYYELYLLASAETPWKLLVF